MPGLPNSKSSCNRLFQRLLLPDQAGRGIPGVVMRESLVLFREPPGELDWVASVRRVRPAGADELPPGYAHGLRFVVPLVEMPLYLPWLMDQVRTLGGELRRRHVDALSDLFDDATDAVVNCSGLAARSIRRCRDIGPALSDASVIEHVVGLRPGRPTVRVEEDAREHGETRVVHNYGHGGSGITVSWGCARDVTRLLLPDDRG